MQYKWVVLTVTVIGVFMVGINARIVIIGLPIVAAALSADVEQAIWITQAYVLVSTVALLFVGRLSDTLGRVRLYTYGFALFTVGSGLTALGQDAFQVILFRGIQGLGASLIFANSLAMIVDSTPEKELGFALGVNQIAFRFGTMAGLTLSGIILSFFSWQALFYVNLPIGFFGTLWAKRRLKEMAALEKSSPMDWVGFLAFTISITSLMLVLTFAAYGTATVMTTSSFIVVTLAAFAVFIHHEKKAKHPLLDLKLFRIKEFAGGILAQLLNATAWSGVLLLLSLYFQLVLGRSAFETGIDILPFDFAMLALGPVSGKLSDKFGHMPFTTSGLALTSLSLYLFSTVDISTPYFVITIYMVLLGIGTGLFISPNTSSIMGSVPAKRRGVASAVRSLAFNVGLTMSLNLAILIMTFTIPYSTITSIISAINPSTISQIDRTLFANSLKQTYLYFTLINALAILPSIYSGSRKKTEE